MVSACAYLSSRNVLCVVATVLETPGIEAVEECGVLASCGRYESLYIHLWGQHKKEQMHLRDRRRNQIGALSAPAMWPTAPGFSPDIRDRVSDQLGQYQTCLDPAYHTKREWEGGRWHEYAG